MASRIKSLMDRLLYGNRLDVTSITPRLIACGPPKRRKVGEHSNAVEDLAAELNKEYGQHYMLWNLTPLGGGDDEDALFGEKLRHRIVACRDTTADVPSIDLAFKFCYMVNTWLLWHPHNVAVVFCKDGIRHTSFFISMYLAYVNPGLDTMQSLMTFAEKRGPVRIPNSWRFLLTQVNSLLLQPTRIADRICLAKILLEVPDALANADLVVELLENGISVYDSSNVAVEDETCEFLLAEDHVVLTPMIVLQGDIVMRVSCMLSGVSREEQGTAVPVFKATLVARLAFHTSLAPVNTLLRFTLDRIDCPHPMLSTSEFVADLVIAEAESAPLGGPNVLIARKQPDMPLNLRSFDALAEGVRQISSRMRAPLNYDTLIRLCNEGYDSECASVALLVAGDSDSGLRQVVQWLRSGLLHKIAVYKATGLAPVADVESIDEEGEHTLVDACITPEKPISRFAAPSALKDSPIAREIAHSRIGSDFSIISSTSTQAYCAFCGLAFEPSTEVISCAGCSNVFHVRQCADQDSDVVADLDTCEVKPGATGWTCSACKMLANIDANIARDDTSGNTDKNSWVFLGRDKLSSTQLSETPVDVESIAADDEVRRPHGTVLRRPLLDSAQGKSDDIIEASLMVPRTVLEQTGKPKTAAGSAPPRTPLAALSASRSSGLARSIIESEKVAVGAAETCANNAENVARDTNAPQANPSKQPKVVDSAVTRTCEVKPDTSKVLTVTGEAKAFEDEKVPTGSTGSDGGDGGRTAVARVLAKYSRMLSVGVPLGAVKQRMVADGIASALVDRFPEDQGASPVAPTLEVKATSNAVEPGVDMSKYEKMISVGVPKGAVRSRMVQDGVSAAECEAFCSRTSLNNSGSTAGAEQGRPAQPPPPPTTEPAAPKLSGGTVPVVPRSTPPPPPVIAAGPPKALSAPAQSSAGVPPPPPSLPGGAPRLPGAPVAPKAPRGTPAAPGKAPAAPAGPAPARVQRKRLHWDAVAADNIDATIWGTTTTENPDLCDEDFENLFVKKASSPPNGSTAVGAVAAVARPVKRALLDVKRGTNVAIALSRIKLPYSVIRECLLALRLEHGHHRILPEQLPMILELVPTTAELQLITSYPGSITELAEAEQFFAEMAGVPKMGARVSALIYQQQFAQLVQQFRESLATLRRATDEVRNSSKLKAVLEAVLVVGNRLNGSAGGEGVRGFTLNSLLKLSQVKAFNQRTTVLSYIASLLARKNPDALQLREELTSLANVARLTRDSLNTDITTLRNGLASVERVVRECCGVGSAVGAIAAVAAQHAAVDARLDALPLHAFVAAAQRVVSAVEADLRSAMSSFDDLVQYFGEQADSGPDTFFGTLDAFAKELARAHAENVAITSRQARAAKATRPSEKASGDSAVPVLKADK